AFSVICVAGPDAQPAFFARVVTRIRNVGSIEYVDCIATVDLQKISRHDGGRAADLRASRDDHAGVALFRERGATSGQNKENENNNAFGKSHLFKYGQSR